MPLDGQHLAMAPRSEGRMKLTALALTSMMGCGSSSYLVQRGTEQQRILPAIAEDRGVAVRIDAAKLRLAAAERLSDAQLRVRPKRPLALVISGAIVLALGAGMTAGGMAGLFKPSKPNLPESGGSYGDGIVLAFGCAHV